MTTYLVCTKDPLNPISPPSGSPESIAIEIAVAIQNDYKIQSLTATKASSDDALVARLANRAICAIDLDEELIRVWEEEANPIISELSNLDFGDALYEACQKLNQRVYDMYLFCRDSEHFADLNTDIEGYMDYAINAFYEQNEELINERLRKLFHYEEIA